MTPVILPQSAWAGELPHEAARHFFAQEGRIWRVEMNERLTDEQLLYLLRQVDIQAMRIPSGVRIMDYEGHLLKGVIRLC